MSEHTPGPWEVYCWADHTELAGYPSSVGNSDELGMEQADVCRIDCTEVTKAEAWANARLIAKSPELFEKLRELFQMTNPLITCDLSEFGRLRRDVERLLKEVDSDFARAEGKA
ncbi:MAG: hypothetical protein AAGH89_18715 [Verrucomicrobiota bacterium]